MSPLEWLAANGHNTAGVTGTDTRSLMAIVAMRLFRLELHLFWCDVVWSVREWHWQLALLAIVLWLTSCGAPQPVDEGPAPVAIAAPDVSGCQATHDGGTKWDCPSGLQISDPTVGGDEAKKAFGLAFFGEASP